MIKIIDIANNISKEFNDLGIIHKIFIDINFALDVRYVMDETLLEKIPKYDVSDDKQELQKLLNEFTQKTLSGEDTQELLIKINELKSSKSVANAVGTDSNDQLLQDYICQRAGITLNDYNISFQSYSKEDYDYSELSEDGYFVNDVKELFEGNCIETYSRYRFNSHFEKKANHIEGQFPPVVTFYSYKGGMGRTTTMTSYAIRKAFEGKRVFVIDCDLEAPGYLNFFKLSQHNLLKSGERNGFVEMVSDLEFSKQDKNFNFENYYINIVYGNDEANDYNSWLQRIYLMPAGNLNETVESGSSINREHYFEGLSRINLANPNVIKNAFQRLFTHLKEDLDIDLILIDSRTGFNDIIDANIKYFSKMIVGFFGSNEQSIPGLLNLMDEYYKNDFDLCLVNAILPQNDDRVWTDTFNSIIEGYTEEKDTYNSEEDIRKNKSLPFICGLHRKPMYENIGIRGYNDKVSEQYYKSILEDTWDDYADIFTEINYKVFGENADVIGQTNTDDVVNPDTDDSFVVDAPSVTVKPNKKSDYLERLSNLSTLNLKNIILQNLKETLRKISNFAEDCEMDEKLFFYRDCMTELFDQDKFIIRGYKGTGKTYLYRALKIDVIRKNLLDRTNKKRSKYFPEPLPKSDYISIQIIDTNKGEKIKFFPFGIFMNKEIRLQYNFTKFWRLHTWNSIMLELKKDSEFKDIFECSKIKDYVLPIIEETAEKNYKSILLGDNTDFFIELNNDMDRINDYLRARKKKMFILYDQLDSRVNPLIWDDIVSPLINYWNDNYSRFTNILPKIFVRTDLMKRIQGTNTARLQNHFIEIEWTIEEILSYFIQLSLSNEVSLECIRILLNKRIKRYSRLVVPDYATLAKNQYQLDNYLESSINPYVYLFFGSKVVDNSNRYWGTPNVYFKNNLCNADKKSISLRPFINTLDKNAIEVAIGDPSKYVTAVIPCKSYAIKSVRDKATNTYFDDLTQDEYSKDLIKFREVLDSKEGDPYRYKSLSLELYESLLSTVFEKYKEDFKVVKNPDDLSLMLEANGIIHEKVTRDGKFYQFAPLYYYIWALKNSKFDDNEEIESKFDKRYVGKVVKDYRGYFVVTDEARWFVDGDYPMLLNKTVQFDLKAGKSRTQPGKIFYSAVNLKKYEDNEYISE